MAQSFLRVCIGFDEATLSVHKGLVDHKVVENKQDHTDSEMYNVYPDI